MDNKEDFSLFLREDDLARFYEFYRYMIGSAAVIFDALVFGFFRAH